MAMMKTPEGNYYIEAPTKDDLMAEANLMGDLCEGSLKPLSHYAVPSSFLEFTFSVGAMAATLRKNGNATAADMFNAAVVHAYATFLMEDAVAVDRFGHASTKGSTLQ